MTPVLSVVVPVEGPTEHLAEAVGSALRQTLTDIEVVVAVAGPAHSAAAALRRLAGHPRVVVIEAEGLGEGACRNSGLRRARGGFVGFLDPTDRWHPEKAEAHLGLFEALPGLDLVGSCWRIVDLRGRDTGRRGAWPKGRVDYDDLLRSHPLWSISTVVARRPALQRAGCFDENQPAHSDLDLWLRLARRRAGAIACLGEALTDLRLGARTPGLDWRRLEGGWLQVVEKARRADPGRVAALAGAGHARHARWLAYLAYEAGAYEDARRLLAQAWRRAPFSLCADRRSWLTTAAVACTLLPAAAHAHLDRLARRLRARQSPS